MKETKCRIQCVLRMIALILAFSVMVVGCGERNDDKTDKDPQTKTEAPQEEVNKEEVLAASTDTPLEENAEVPVETEEISNKSEMPKAEETQKAETTTKPKSTPKAETATKPKATEKPAVTSKAEVTIKPKITPKPEATQKTETTTKPKATPTPEATPKAEEKPVKQVCYVTVEGFCSEKSVSFTSGDTAYDILKKSDALVSATNSQYGIYVEGINGRFASGNSGWMYSVNGYKPNKSADKYAVSTGDTVTWYWGSAY